MATYQVQRTRIARAKEQQVLDEMEDLPPNYFISDRSTDKYYGVGHFTKPIDVISTNNSSDGAIVVARMLGMKYPKEFILEGNAAVASSREEEITELPDKVQKLRHEGKIRDYTCDDEHNCILKVDS